MSILKDNFKTKYLGKDFQASLHKTKKWLFLESFYEKLLELGKRSEFILWGSNWSTFVSFPLLTETSSWQFSFSPLHTVIYCL